MSIIVIVLGFILIAGFLLAIRRQFDHRADHAEELRLSALQPLNPDKFSTSLIADLPDPARRYFEYTILPGTPLLTVAALELGGQFSLGTKEAPNYMSITAHQVLAAPNGFIWKMSGDGFFRLSGSDSASWTRFWIAGVLPVARPGSNVNHARAAFGRYIAEAVFWTPAALLPGKNIEWFAVDKTTAKVRVTHNGMMQDVFVTVTSEGQPMKIRFLRWSDANPDKVYRLQPFGGYLSEFREFDGFRLPTHVEAGNFFATDAYFPFYKIDLNAFRFPGSNQ